MRTWVAMLRGVNLGKRRQVSMPLLRAALAQAGFADVRTYVNSGNAVLRSEYDDPGDVAEQVRRVVEERFMLDDVPVAVRAPEHLADVLAWNPFPEAAATRPQLVSVVHLLDLPPPDGVAALLDADLGPDQVAVRGPEVVVAYAERSGGGRSDAALRRLGVGGTARNWRTLRALVDLSRGAQSS